ncbi:uncharacterized protein LOC130647762 [Hydractinia symbiolongicarpus]|uniref:uncharacterized protein LOC130647762 n=1 Tax=Hydractinia symbiolongicarpus TaxID=13093 RepID=UPI00254B73EE|nr:uncharacterized protein LOC130647762 [Hydractinia symbiolongicarpus]
MQRKYFDAMEHFMVFIFVAFGQIIISQAISANQSLLITLTKEGSTPFLLSDLAKVADAVTKCVKPEGICHHEDVIENQYHSTIKITLQNNGTDFSAVGISISQRIRTNRFKRDMSQHRTYPTLRVKIFIRSDEGLNLKQLGTRKMRDYLSYLKTMQKRLLKPVKTKPDKVSTAQKKEVSKHCKIFKRTTVPERTIYRENMQLENGDNWTVDKCLKRIASVFQSCTA